MEDFVTFDKNSALKQDEGRGITNSSGVYYDKNSGECFVFPQCAATSEQCSKITWYVGVKDQ